MRRWVHALFATAPLVVSCSPTAGDSVNACNQSIPAACGDIAGCVLGTDQYLQGAFPSMESFVVRTQNPEQVTFSFQFTNRISAGTTLTLTATEPDCSDQSSYTSPGDIFEISGASGILTIPITFTEAGDHLIQFSSDAYCSYELSYD